MRFTPLIGLMSLVGSLGCQGGSEAPVGPSGAVTPEGTIRGVVRLKGDAPEGVSLAVEKDRDICGARQSVTRLALGVQNGIRNAIVYLEGVSLQVSRQSVTVTIDQSNCEYLPHMMAVPLGTQLEIVNNDPILHNVHAREVSERGLQTLFNIAQPIRGQRTSIEQTRVRKPGLLVLSCEAGHPWMSAYVFVSEHPYVTVTDENGEFVLEGVPGGTYGITMWHEGIRLTRVMNSVQRYEFEDPYEVRQQVEVVDGGDATVDFELVLREVAGSGQVPATGLR